MDIIKEFKLTIADKTLTIREATDKEDGDYTIHDNATDKDYNVYYSEFHDDMTIAIFEVDENGVEGKCLVHEYCNDPFGVFGDAVFGAFMKFYNVIQA